MPFRLAFYEKKEQISFQKMDIGLGLLVNPMLFSSRIDALKFIEIESLFQSALRRKLLTLINSYLKNRLIDLGSRAWSDGA